MTLPGLQTECQNPACTKTAEHTYTDRAGNRLHLCEGHYYKQVTGRYAVSVVEREGEESDVSFLDRILGREGSHR